MTQPTDRDIELAEKAADFLLLSPPPKRIANIALLFALARSEGRAAALRELRADLHFYSTVSC
jgi:hypothetical protein